MPCLDQIPGRCFPYQDCVIAHGRKTRAVLPRPDQIQGRSPPLQIKDRGRKPLLDQLPVGVISTRALLSFRSKMPDWVAPFRSNTRGWIHPPSQIPGRRYPLGALYHSGVIPSGQVPGNRVPSPGRLPGVCTPFRSGTRAAPPPSDQIPGRRYHLKAKYWEGVPHQVKYQG